MANADVRRLVTEVQRLGTRALPYPDLHREITDRLRGVMRIDAACWHGLDPDNVLLTTANPVELLAGGFLTPDSEMVAARAVLASEYQRRDVNTFASLARRRLPSAILYNLVFIGEADDHLQYLEPLALGAWVQGAAVHDARIAAVCIAHGVTELRSADRDFARFPALKTHNPVVG